MENFVISGQSYFDRLPEAILVERQGQICYYNVSLAENVAVWGIDPEEGVLPEALKLLEDGVEETLLLGGRSVQVRVTVLEDGARLYRLEEVVERGGLGRYEAELLCERLHELMSAEKEGLQALYDQMVETEQERLDPCFQQVFRQYCRILRCLNTAEFMAVPKEEWLQDWDAETEVIDLSAFFEELDYELVPVLSKLTMTYDVEEELYIKGNRQMLRQAMMHLIQNGIQHGLTVEVRLKKQGDSAVITVTDLGGDPISPEAMAKLYAPCTEEDLEGTTLKQGLKLCRRVFDLHGGSMALSNLSKGVVVTASLPLTDLEEAEKERKCGDELDDAYFEEEVPEFMVEMSEVLEEKWYPACEMLE